MSQTRCRHPPSGKFYPGGGHFIALSPLSNSAFLSFISFLLSWFSPHFQRTSKLMYRSLDYIETSLKSVCVLSRQNQNDTPSHPSLPPSLLLHFLPPPLPPFSSRGPKACLHLLQISLNLLSQVSQVQFHFLFVPFGFF